MELLLDFFADNRDKGDGEEWFTSLDMMHSIGELERDRELAEKLYFHNSGFALAGAYTFTAGHLGLASKPREIRKCFDNLSTGHSIGMHPLMTN